MRRASPVVSTLMKSVFLSSENWSYERVWHARGFLERLRGMKMVGPGQAVLLETSSVHAIGVKHAFRAVGLSHDYVVMRIVTVRPWSIVSFPGCRYVVELPLEIDPPPVGARLEVSSV